MTHRGPFQPLPFCDSVILYGEEERGGDEVNYRVLHAAFERALRNTDEGWARGNCDRPPTTHHRAG